MEKTGLFLVISAVLQVLSFQVPTIFFLQNIDGHGLGSEVVAMPPPVEVQAVVSGSLPQVFAGYCQLGQSTITFSNLGMAGDPAESTLNDLSLGIALGDAFLLSENGFGIAGLRIGGVDLTDISTMNPLDGNALFTTDPDGPGGLSDADGDGFFDDLAMGESVEITAFYRFDCDFANDNNGDCLNNLGTKLSARMGYVEQGSTELFELADYLRPAHRNTAFENLTDPDAFLGVDTFSITHRHTRSIRFFDAGCGGDGELLVRVDLPNGVTPILSSTLFLKNTLDTLTLLSSEVTNGELLLTYDATMGSSLSGEYELRMAFVADCFAGAGPSIFPFTLEHYCASCDCQHTWFCGDLPGPQFHVTSPPCPIEVVPPCDKGVRTVSFSAERATFGFSDPAFTQPFSPQAANKKVALGCDSVRMDVVSVVGTNPISDSVGVVITYANPNGSNSPAEVFLFDRGSVRFTHDGNEFDCPVSPAQLSVVDDAGMKTLTFDLHDCVASLGFALSAGDTIDFSGDFSVNPNGPFASNFSLVPNFRGFAFAQVSGEEFACDNFGEVFTLGKSRAIYDFPNSPAGQPQGCEEGELHFRLFVPDNEFSDFFGNEFRAAPKIDSFTLSFDPQLLSVYENAEVEVSIPGHPVFGNAYFPIRPLSDFPAGNYVAIFDTLAYVPSLNLVEEYTFDLRLRLSPTCVVQVSNDFELVSQIHFRDQFYARTIGDGSCVMQKTENGSSELNYTSPPQLTLTPLTPAFDTVQGGVANWRVRLCNVSPSANAETVWMAVENAGGDLSLANLADLTNGFPSLPTSSYPEGSFSFLPTLSAGDCLDLEIEAGTDECGLVNFKVLSGWNCGPFLAGWNPTEYAPCQSTSLPLVLVNLADAPLSIDFQEVTSQCEEGGGELISFSGQLSSTIPLPTDDYTLTFVFDENGNGITEQNEVVLAEIPVSGALAPGSNLPFGHTFLATPEQACQIIVELSAGGTNLCAGVSVLMPAPQILNAGEDQSFCRLDGTALTTILGDPTCGADGYTFTWSALPPANANDLSNVNAAAPTLALGWADFLGQTLNYVVETERTDCGVSTFDTIGITLPLSPNGFFETDSMVIQIADCQGFGEVCMAVLNTQISSITITDNGMGVPSSTFVPCEDTLTAVPLAVGTHEVIATDEITGCADTIFAVVRCAVTETLSIDIVLNQSDTICFGDAEIFGELATLTNFCEDGAFVGYEVLEDSCLILSGNWVGMEQACILACDDLGFCDTTFLQINVTHPIPNGVKDSIVIEQLGQFCFDENLLNLAGPIETIENICPEQSGTSVNFSFQGDENCLYYFGVNLGVDTACVRLCDAEGNCDTVSVCVSVIPGDVFYDTIFIQVDTQVFCLADSLLPGEITMVEDICPDSNGDEVQFVYDGGVCFSYFGDAVGQDTACVRFEDEFGNVGLVELIVTVVRTIPETICDAVFIGEVKTVCLDTSELPGNFVYIEEICPDVRTGNVDIFIDPLSLCVDYEGLMEGRDSACIVVCDDFGFCDSTFLCLEVAPYFDLPTLGNDTTSTQKGTPIVIDFLANDTLFGGISDIYILEQPISGSAILNLQNSFTYIPDEPYCARWDNFTYVACNPNGCDTAMVSIFVECIELTVFSAVSPNNDGVNDVFFIAKIEDFPDNHLWVYNRWGNLVYEKNEYENSWPGNWGEDIDLPDGTYYYVLEWSDGGEVTVQRGYFEMFR